MTFKNMTLACSLSMLLIACSGGGGSSNNAAPTVSGVNISGTPADGETLTGQYTYSDVENDSEGVSTFRWLRNGVIIPGETSNTYILTSGDIGNQIEFAVTPMASTGATAGMEVLSGATTVTASIFSIKCNTTTEAAFVTDAFIDNAIADRPWVNNQLNSATELFDVAYIAAEFNAARANDPTIKEKLKMPNQSIWDGYTTSQKILYLINSERCSRGIMPFEGIDPRLVDIAQSYADHLTANDIYTYGIIGYAGAIPAISRFAAAGINMNVNADTTLALEHTVYFNKSTLLAPTLSEVEARSVYLWFYADYAATVAPPNLANLFLYANRRFLLDPGLSGNNDYGSVDTEGLIGAGMQTKASTTVSGGTTLQTSTARMVLDIFNPNANYVPNAGDVITPAPAFIPPSSQSDCIFGTYQASAMSCM